MQLLIVLNTDQKIREKKKRHDQIQLKLTTLLIDFFLPIHIHIHATDVLLCIWTKKKLTFAGCDFFSSFISSARFVNVCCLQMKFLSSSVCLNSYYLNLCLNVNLTFNAMFQTKSKTEKLMLQVN